MIHQWEILHYPTEADAQRYRLSLWADSEDVSKICNLYSGRVGGVWIPTRKPFNAAFFLYQLKLTEKNELEDILSGKIAIPEPVSPAYSAESLNENLTHEDTQEVKWVDQPPVPEDKMSSGVGGVSTKNRKLKIGYFVPENLLNSGEIVHSILSRTLWEKKISVEFEQSFAFTYKTLSAIESNRLLKRCQKYGISKVIVVGDPVQMTGLLRLAQKSQIFIKVLPSAVIDKNFWLTVIAEILSVDI